MALAALTVAPGAARAQDPALQSGRFHIVVPDFFAEGGADRDFGKDAAKELRTLLNTLLTHRALARDDIEDALDRLDLDMDELTCVPTRQLASLMDAQVALCASYTEGDGGLLTVTAVFWDVASAESFAVEPATVREGEEAEAAAHIFRHFDQYTQHLRAAANCEAFAQSEAWELALEGCDEALRLNPGATATRYRRARVLTEMDRKEEALEEVERVLEEQLHHEAALSLGGYLSALLGRNAEARAYYERYLELSPDDASVRMRIAYELAQAGDVRGAMLLIQEGIDLDPENVELRRQLGGYAFSIAESVYYEGLRAVQRGDEGTGSPNAEQYYREAIEAYARVFEARGSETSVGVLRSLAVAHLRLGEAGEAAAWAERGVATDGQDARLWTVYADALHDMNRVEEALTALDRVQELDPDEPRVGLRRGRWLLEGGRIPEAVQALRAVATLAPERADEAARLVLADAHANGVQQDRYDYAVEALEAVRTLPGLSEDTSHALSFWLGYSLLRSAAVVQEPRTLETARATLATFQRALELLGDVGAYPASVRVDIEELRSNVRTYIEIQEAIIRRGG
jgi:tetratricopeptide (TPR) repeat protein